MLLNQTNEIDASLQALHRALLQRQLSIATAESCTGGLLGALLTQLSGSSAYYKGGIIAYANAAKVDLLGVPAAVLEHHGAVSRETALAMVQGVRQRLGTDLAVAVTGIAGPTGGSPEKPVGTVWYAWQNKDELDARLLQLSGDRRTIRSLTSHIILQHIRQLIP